MESIETLPRHLEPSDSHYSACGAPSDVRYYVTITYDGEEVLTIGNMDRRTWLDAGRVLKDIFPRSEGFVYRTEAREQ